jgi:hypothetical protein
MPVGMLQEMQGVDAERYDAVNAAMDIDNNRPAGLIFHTAGQANNGAWRIFDVWESAEDFERFQRDQLLPALQKVMTGPPPGGPPSYEIYELHNVIRP